MSRTRKDSPHARNDRSEAGQRRGRERRISVRAVRRDPPDLKKLSRALIQLAMAQAQAEAEAENAAGLPVKDNTNTDRDKWAPLDSFENPPMDPSAEDRA